MPRATIIIAAALLGAMALAPAQVRAPVIIPSMGAQLATVELLLKDGKADEALNAVQLNLPKYSSMDLSRALYCSGRARAMLADKAPDAAAKRKLQLQAALDFMRVATFFPYSNEAGASLVEAGRLLAALGETNPAKNAFDAAVSRYPNTQAAADAQAAMGAMTPKK